MSYAWRNGPATKRQKEKLRFFGIKTPKGLTKGAASVILDSLNDTAKEAKYREWRDQKDVVDERKEQEEEEWDFRIDGWQDCFRKDTGSFSLESLYEQHGHRYKVPTRAQVRQILETLDRTHPGWEEKHEEAFFATLEANFPERIKTKAKQARSKGSGCVLLILVLVVSIILIRMFLV